MIKIQINYYKLILILRKIIKILIKKRAYKGYCAWLKITNDKPLQYKDFSEFEYWKIKIAFKQYFKYCLKSKLFYHQMKINFKSIILNKI